MISLFFFIAASMSHGQSAKPLDLNPHRDYAPPTGAEQRIEQESLPTREREIYVNGAKFRQIEYDGEIFQVKANQPEQFVDCQKMNLPRDTFAAEASLQVAHRTRLFLESLRQRCDGKAHAIVTSPNALDSNIGLKFKAAEPGGQERTIKVNPVKQTGSLGTSF